MLYVSALTTPQCLEAVGGEAETVAYAAHCQQEGKLDRPVAGHTNICPEAISTAVISTHRHIGHLYSVFLGERYQEPGLNTQT